MEIFLHEAAEKFLENLDEKIQASIKQHLKQLSIDPQTRHLDIKKLKGRPGKQDLFRLRVGEYRVIYAIQDNKIWITEIMLRGKGYDF